MKRPKRNLFAFLKVVFLNYNNEVLDELWGYHGAEGVGSSGFSIKLKCG